MRKKKKRTAERRYSEGEASDYEAKAQDSHESSKLPEKEQSKSMDKRGTTEIIQKHDSGVDLTEDIRATLSMSTKSIASGKASGKRAQKKTIDDDELLNLEFKCDMIFDIDM